MSGRVPPSSKAGSRGIAGGSELARAARRYQRFTGHDPEVLGEIEIRPLPKTAACIGEVTAICYVTNRDGRIEHYKHEFSRDAAPLFCVSPDGKQLLLVGGNFTFTERGIVDRRSRKS